MGLSSTFELGDLALFADNVGDELRQRGYRGSDADLVRLLTRTNPIKTVLSLLDRDEPTEAAEEDESQEDEDEEDRELVLVDPEDVKGINRIRRLTNAIDPGCDLSDIGGLDDGDSLVLVKREDIDDPHSAVHSEVWDHIEGEIRDGISAKKVSKLLRG